MLLTGVRGIRLRSLELGELKGGERGASHVMVTLATCWRGATDTQNLPSPPYLAGEVVRAAVAAWVDGVSGWDRVTGHNKRRGG
jgi:hypothetical protein